MVVHIKHLIYYFSWIHTIEPGKENPLAFFVSAFIYYVEDKKNLYNNNTHTNI